MGPSDVRDEHLGDLAAMCLDVVAVGVAVLDADLVIRYANAALADINALAPADHVGRALVDVVPNVSTLALETIRDALTTGRSTTDLHIDLTNTTGRTFNGSYVPVTLPDGTPGVVAMIRDTTGQSRMERRIRTIGERLQQLTDANVIGVLSGEGDAILDANEYVLRMIGRTRADLEAGVLDWALLTPPGGVPVDQQIRKQLLATGECPAFETEVLHRDGHRVAVALTGVLFEGEPARWLMQVLDTSTQRRAERRAAALIELTAALAGVSSIDDVVAAATVVADPGSNLTVEIADLNQPAATMPAHLRHALQSLVVEATEHDGRGFAVPIVDGSAGPVAAVLLHHPIEPLDVHEQGFARAMAALLSAAVTQLHLRQQRQLAELAGALEAMIEMVQVGRAMRDADGAIVDFRIEFVNSSSRDIDGRGAAEMTGRTMLELHPELAGSPLFEAHCRVVETGEHYEDPELVVHSSDPAAHDQVHHLSISRFGDGFLACRRDVTSRAHAQAQLTKSERQLAEAQRLARMGSWEWNLDTGERNWTKELFRILEIDPNATPEEGDSLMTERIHPDDRELGAAVVAQGIASGRPFRYEQRLVLPSGERRTVVQGQVTTEDRGRIYRGTLRDVTEWRRAQEESEHGRLALESMQRACLPETLPLVPGLDIDAHYRPAHAADRLGGDWYDSFDLPDGRVALVVGDVTGHGLPAAVEMSQLRNALRAFAINGESPAQVLENVGRFMRLNRSITSFATCLYATLDPRDGTLRWARAGHPGLLIIGPTGWKCPEAGGGPPLGVHADGYTEQEGRLPAGSLLALYTDGLVEERGETIDEGIARLGERLRRSVTEPLGPLTQSIIDELLTERSNIDDACLLLVRWAPDGATN